MRIILPCAALFAAMAVRTPAPAQSVDPRHEHVKTREECVAQVGPLPVQYLETFPEFELRRLSVDRIRLLRGYLRADCWEHALRLFFSESRQTPYVDWVVYIDSAGTVHQAVTRGNRVQQEFRSEKYVWGIVFSDRYIAPGDSGRELQFNRRSVNYQRDPLLSAVVKAVTGKFFSAVEPAAAPVPADSSKLMELSQLSAEPEVAALYVAQERFGLAENTEVVLSLRAAPGSPGMPGNVRSIYANLGNAAPSLWEVGITAGASFGEPTEVVTDTVVTGTRSGTQPNLYLTGYLNLVRPRLPWSRFSVGPAIGVNLVRGGFFDEVMVGVAAGRLMGDVGVIAGATGTNVTTLVPRAGATPPQRRERREMNFFAGMDLRF